MYSRADPNVKTTSIPEEKLLIEFKRRRMPEPDRNYKFTRDDGKELTVPDFTWEDMKIAFFMDGSYWHSVKSDQDIIKEIKSSKKMQDTIVQKRKDKVRKDGAIRSELSARGWMVLSCTDDDIETSEGLKEIVDMVERAMDTISSVNKVVADRGANQQGADSIMDFLDGKDDIQEENKEDISSDESGNNNDAEEENREENKDGKEQNVIDFINSTAEDSTDSVQSEEEDDLFNNSLRYEDM